MSRINELLAGLQISIDNLVGHLVKAGVIQPADLLADLQETYEKTEAGLVEQGVISDAAIFSLRLLIRAVEAMPVPKASLTASEIEAPGNARDVFERAYRPLEDGAMNFGQALTALKAGRCVARIGWNGKGLWLELQWPDTNSEMTLPYIYLNYSQDAQNTPGARVPWLASQTDVLAGDWVFVE